MSWATTWGRGRGTGCAGDREEPWGITGRRSKLQLPQGQGAASEGAACSGGLTRRRLEPGGGGACLEAAKNLL
jgi:hypothetical protein